MRSSITVLERIPPLAWIVEIGDKPRILIGGGVDVRTYGGRLQVTEGCWEAGFGSDVRQARHLFGSGIVAEAGEMVFCAASHTFEALYVFRGADTVLVSNSLAFLVKQSGIELDASIGIYRSAHTVLAGLRSYDRLIYRKGADSIFRYAYCNFRVRDGEVETFKKAPPPDFPDYASYRDYMLDVLRGVFANAADPARKGTYRPLASLSSGYDSVASAALAAAVGCDRAVTLTTGRGGPVDSGRPAAEALGLACVERERRLPAGTEAGFVEVPFIVSFDSGDCAFATFADLLPGALLMTGHYGGGLWSLTDPPDDGMRRTDPSGMGLHEFRLRTNFVCLQVPAIAGLRHSHVRRIGLSEELRPYRVGGPYDRPVPRRIAEEAGVPRALFGQKKKAVNVNLWHAEKMMNAPTRAAIGAYVSQHAGALLMLEERLFRGAQYLLDLTAGNIDGPVAGKFKRIGFLLRRARPLNRRFEYRWGTHYRNYFGHVMVWALAQAGEAYDTAAAPKQARRRRAA